MTDVTRYSMELLEAGAAMFGWRGNALAPDDPWLVNGTVLLRRAALAPDDLEALDVPRPQGPAKKTSADFLPSREALDRCSTYPIPEEWALGHWEEEFGLKAGPDFPGTWSDATALACVDPTVGQGGLWVNAWSLALITQVLARGPLDLQPGFVREAPGGRRFPVMWWLDCDGDAVAGLVGLYTNRPVCLFECDPVGIHVGTHDGALWAKAMTQLPTWLASLYEEG